MKKKLLRMLLFVITMYSLIIPNAYAVEYKTDGNFKYYVEDGQAYLFEYNGDEENVVIPNEVEGLPVKGIGYKTGFYNVFNEDIKTLTIPSGVEYIGKSALHYCQSLKSVIIPNTVTFIGEKAFRKCNSLTEITIPESVTTIEDYAFEECENLVAANILGSVVGENMFARCENLTTVNLGENVTKIGELAFIGCENITEITIPESVTTIEPGAFRATGIESIIIPESITKMGYNIFQYCYDLEKVVFKNPNTTFEEVAGIREHVMDDEKDPTFAYCDNLSVFYAFKGSQAQNYSLNNNLEFVPIANVEINGERVKSDIPAIIKNNRVLIPMRAIFEKFGAEVDWNGETRTVTAAAGDKMIVMQIGEEEIGVNGEIKEIDVAPQMLMNRTIVPARAVSESLGATVEWDEARQTVVINY